MRDLYRNVLVTQVFNPAVSSTTRTSAAVDLQGFNSLCMLISLGASGDTLSGSVFWTLKLTHSDDDAVYSDVTAADLANASATVVVNSASLDKMTHVFGYLGSKRYVKAVATPTGTHTSGTPIGMTGLRGTPAYAPVI